MKKLILLSLSVTILALLSFFIVLEAVSIVPCSPCFSYFAFVDYSNGTLKIRNPVLTIDNIIVSASPDSSPIISISKTSALPGEDLTITGIDTSGDVEVKINYRDVNSSLNYIDTATIHQIPKNYYEFMEYVPKYAEPNEYVRYYIYGNNLASMKATLVENSYKICEVTCPSTTQCLCSGIFPQVEAGDYKVNLQVCYTDGSCTTTTEGYPIKVYSYSPIEVKSYTSDGKTEVIPDKVVDIILEIHNTDTYSINHVWVNIPWNEFNSSMINVVCPSGWTGTWSCDSTSENYDLKSGGTIKITYKNLIPQSYFDKDHLNFLIFHRDGGVHAYSAEFSVIKTITTTISLQCTDTDGGKNYYVKGCMNNGVCDKCGLRNNDGTLTEKDYCKDEQNCVLFEVYCTPSNQYGAYYSDDYKCPYGCKDGACLTQITTTIPESDWHYVIVHKDQEPGWYCINITTQSRLKFEFRKVNPDYARCLWAVIDYDGPYISADNCAPKSWGCYNSGGTLTPYNCWNFAGCTADGGKLYRLCASSSGSFVVDLDKGAKVACAYATVWPEDCPGKNCWQARITETSEPPTPLPSDLSIKITSPVNGQTVSGTVTVKATAKGSNKLGEMYFGVQKEGENIGVMYPFKNCTEGGGCTSGGTCTYTKECQYSWDSSKYNGGVILTALITDDKGNKATDTIKVNVKAITPINIDIVEPMDGQRVSGVTTVVVSASGPNELTNMSLSIGQTFTTEYGGGGSGVMFYLKDCVDSVACPSGGTTCTYYKKCRYNWDTTRYDGTVFLTANIGDVKDNIATDTVKVYVINYQSCYEQCKSKGYMHGTCKTDCDAGEVNIGVDGCPQVCPTCPAGEVCPPCKTSTCCCASKKTCPYECCVNDPDYLDKNCPMVTCPVCKPDEECPPCIQPKCIDHQCVWYPQEEFILNFKAGWNMFSFPVDIRSYLTATSQPVSELTVEKAITGKITEVVTTTTQATYQRCPSPDHVWHYSNGEYIDVLKDPNSIVNGWGYWVKMDYDCMVTMTGNKITIDDFPELNAGWNQIGAPSESINFYKVIGDCTILSGPWWYNSASKKYEKAQVLKPGQGYFVKVKDKCSLGSEIPPPPPETTSATGMAIKMG